MQDIDLRIRSRMTEQNLSTVVAIRAPDFRHGYIDQEQSDLSSLSLLEQMTFENFSLRRDELPLDEQENLEGVLDLCQGFAKAPDGWLVLTGEYGCGKTHLAAAIANERSSTGEPVLFVVVPDLLDHLRATFSPSSQVQFDRRFEEVRTAPMLVLDDLGTESASPWAKEKLFQLFNYRYNARLPTIITMAQPIGEADPRLRTRMLDMKLCTVFAILAPSYREAVRRQAPRRGRSRSRKN
jgi:DNA replication protein DnaC